MNPDTAELAIAERAREPGLALSPPRRLALRSLDPAQRAAVRDSWRALWSSRLLVLAAGVGTVLAFGYGPVRNAFNPPGVTRGFGWLGNLLAAPVAHWDSDWYLVVAKWGYRPDLSPFTSTRDAFMPLYPLGIRTLGMAGVPLIVGGVVISLAAFALALYGVHRLTTLELGSLMGGNAEAEHAANTPRLAVLLLAFAPMALFFSTVYSESLFLAFTVGLFWSARHGRWALAGVLGALAGATRSTGLMLIVPLLVLYLYGPRADRAPDLLPRRAAVPGGRARRWAGAIAGALRPRYRVRASILWLGLVPCGVLLYAVWLALNGGELLAPLHAEHAWGRHFVGPYLGVWDGAKAAFDGLRQLLSFQSHHVYFRYAVGSPTIAAGHNLMAFAFVLAAVPMIVGVFRRLPFAYGAFVLAALAPPLSYPVLAQPLMSLPRYMVVLFPLYMWLAAWLARRPRLVVPVLVLSGVAMGFFEAQFATWHWVA